MVVAAELLQCLGDAAFFPVFQRDEATLDTVENKLDGGAGDLLLDVDGKPVYGASEALSQCDQFVGLVIRRAYHGRPQQTRCERPPSFPNRRMRNLDAAMIGKLRRLIFPLRTFSGVVFREAVYVLA